MFASIWQPGRLCWGVTMLPCSGCVRQQVSEQPVWARSVSTLHNFTGRCECRVTADNLGVCVCHQHPTRLLNSRWQKWLYHKQSTRSNPGRMQYLETVWERGRAAVWMTPTAWNIKKFLLPIIFLTTREDKYCSRMVLRLILQLPRCCPWRRCSRIGPLSHQTLMSMSEVRWRRLRRWNLRMLMTSGTCFLCYSRGLWVCFALTYGCRAPSSGESYIHKYYLFSPHILLLL